MGNQKKEEKKEGKVRRTKTLISIKKVILLNLSDFIFSRLVPLASLSDYLNINIQILQSLPSYIYPFPVVQLFKNVPSSFCSGRTYF